MSKIKASYRLENIPALGRLETEFGKSVDQRSGFHSKASGPHTAVLRFAPE